MIRMLPWALAAQFALHCVYGAETILYSLDWLPLLLAWIALAVNTRMRVPVLALAVCFTMLNGANNAVQFRRAADMLNHPERYPVLYAGAAGASREPSGSLSVLTGQYGQDRTGANLAETVLNTANVNARQFGKLFERHVDGYIYAQPLYAAGLEIAGKGKRNVVFVATMHNSVYAFDADDPLAIRPYWKVSLGKSVPITGNIEPEIGILSTPVIDPVTATLYAAAVRSDAGRPVLELHALDLATGREKFGGPAAIHAVVPGAGYDSEDGRVALRFDPAFQLQRAGCCSSTMWSIWRSAVMETPIRFTAGCSAIVRITSVNRWPHLTPHPMVRAEESGSPAERRPRTATGTSMSLPPTATPMAYVILARASCASPPLTASPWPIGTPRKTGRIWIKRTGIWAPPVRC